jgi:hypothetical protein
MGPLVVPSTAVDTSASPTLVRLVVVVAPVVVDSSVVQPIVVAGAPEVPPSSSTTTGPQPMHRSATTLRPTTPTTSLALRASTRGEPKGRACYE